MATATTTNTSYLPFSPLERNSTPSSLHQSVTMFSSIKHKLSRKGTGPMSRTDSLKSQQNSHPQTNPSPSTRRPAPGTNNPFQPPGDAPPAYSPAPNAAPLSIPQVTVSQPSQSSQTADDPYAFLNSFDTIFLIDDSGSMAGSLWRETGEALQAITPICTAHDADGIDIFFLNHADSPFHHNVTTSGTVREIFDTVRPGGGTPTGQRLHQILRPYLRKYTEAPETTKPINIICITDGEPSDDVEGPLIQAAKKLDKLEAPVWQVGVQFFQVGRDEKAKASLKQLDDELGEIAGDGEMRDIVDTVPFTGAAGTQLTGDGILKVVLGAVNRRLDRKKDKDLHR